jgi:transcriptional regulator with XRE-family HTH domain
MLNGKIIRKVRGNFTSEEFAEKLGISRNYLLDMEAGRRVNPSLSVLMALRRISMKPIDYFIKEEGRTSKKGGSNG